MANRTKWTAKKEEQFLTVLTETASVTEACAAIGVGRTSAYSRKADNAAFAAAWDNAIDEYSETLEREADRRAVQGTTKPVFYQGIQCGEVQEYSDTLLMFRLKALRPDKYRERSDVKLGGTDGGPVQVQITRRIIGGGS